MIDFLGISKILAESLLLSYIAHIRPLLCPPPLTFICLELLETLTAK